jgi:hypothetical protein
MKLEKGTYHPEGSDLMVIINHIQYQNDKKAKVKLSLINSRNGIVYDFNKKYVLYKDRIRHWALLIL